jgi:hypothetical protein
LKLPEIRRYVIYWHQSLRYHAETTTVVANVMSKKMSSN